MILSQDFDKSYEELMKFLQSQDLIHHMKNKLKDYNVQISTKKFLSFFMIYFHHKEILDNNEEICQEFLKQIKRCIRVYDSLVSNYKPFKLHIFRFTVTETEKWFDIWKKQDKYKILLQMIHMYHYLKDQKTNDMSWNDEIDKQMNLLETKIVNFDTMGKELLNNPPRIQINTESQQNIIKVIYKAYWDKFEKSIEKKEWNQLLGFIDEIKKMLKNLIPNRTDLHPSIDFKLDTSIIKTMLDNNMLSNEYIFELMLFIINYVREFQSPSDDQDTEEWWNHLQLQTSLNVLLRDFFMVVFAKLEKITIVSRAIKNNILK